MSRDLLKLISEKFTSGNSVEVERITITRAEYEDLLAKPEQVYDHASDALSILADINVDLIRDAKPEQEPVAWVYHRTFDKAFQSCDSDDIGAIPLYTTPPRKEWVGLTDEQKKEATAICKASWHSWAVDPIALCNYVETKLKEKNT